MVYGELAVKLRHDLVLIEWDDASPVLPGWQLANEIKTAPQIAYTVGFVLKRTREHLIVASTFDDDLATNHHFQLPRRMIRQLFVIAKRGESLMSLVPQKEIATNANPAT